MKSVYHVNLWLNASLHRVQDWKTAWMLLCLKMEVGYGASPVWCHLLSLCSWWNLYILQHDDSWGRIPLSDVCSLKFCSFIREMLQSSSFQGKSVVIAEQIRTEERKWGEIRGMFAGTGYVGSSALGFCWRGLVKHLGLHWTPAHYLNQSGTAAVQALGSLCSLEVSGRYLLEQVKWIKPLHSSLALLTPLMMACESTLLPPASWSLSAAANWNLGSGSTCSSGEGDKQLTWLSRKLWYFLEIFHMW